MTSGGKGVAQLTAAMATQPGPGQTLEDRSADVTESLTSLRVVATAVDRPNKRFYSKLQSEARDNPALATALGQIETEGSDLPGTLGIRSILQGGTDHLHPTPAPALSQVARAASSKAARTTCTCW